MDEAIRKDDGAGRRLLRGKSLGRQDVVGKLRDINHTHSTENSVSPGHLVFIIIIIVMNVFQNPIDPCSSNNVISAKNLTSNAQIGTFDAGTDTSHPSQL